MITGFMIVYLLTHCLNKLISIRLLESFGICENFVVGHVQGNCAKGVGNNGIHGTIIKLVQFMNSRNHSISVGGIGR